MKINWEIRLKNPVWWAEIAAAIIELFSSLNCKDFPSHLLITVEGYLFLHTTPLF